ncbi:MAG: helix-turn-helix domain-containing protein [Symbiobacteriia bacterium]
MNSIGSRLKEVREYLGLDIAWVAENSGVKAEVLEQIEAAPHEPMPNDVARLAKLYRYPMTHFTTTPVGPDTTIALLARSDKRLNDIDVAAIERFSEFLKALGTTAGSEA